MSERRSEEDDGSETKRMKMAEVKEPEVVPTTSSVLENEGLMREITDASQLKWTVIYLRSGFLKGKIVVFSK